MCVCVNVMQMRVPPLSQPYVMRVCVCVCRRECHIIEEGLHGSRGGRSAEGGLCQKDVR